jgi:hypothetical protein
MPSIYLLTGRVAKGKKSVIGAGKCKKVVIQRCREIDIIDAKSVEANNAILL